MKKAASEQGIEAEIWAVGANEVKANATIEADIILLGPQVRYAQRKIEAEAPGCTSCSYRYERLWNDEWTICFKTGISNT